MHSEDTRANDLEKDVLAMLHNNHSYCMVVKGVLNNKLFKSLFKSTWGLALYIVVCHGYLL